MAPRCPRRRRRKSACTGPGSLDTTETVTANFVRVFSVDVAPSVEAGGTVTGGGTYDAGASATLAPTAAPSYRFRGWSGGASGTSNPLTIAVDAAATITAVFTPNEAPAFAPALPPQSVDEGALLTFAVSALDPDGDAVTVSARDLPDGAAFEGGRFSWAPSLVQAGDYVVTFTASDGEASTEASVAIAVVHVPPPPVAAAGADRTVPGGATVALDGSNSFAPEGSLASYSWTQTAGSLVALTGAATAEPTFLAPEGGADGLALAFELAVEDEDEGGRRATDEVIVNVAGSANLPSRADAGPSQTAVQGAEVVLSAANSTDPEAAVLTYLWTQLSGPAAALSDATASEPTFTAPAPVGAAAALVFQLSVADPAGLEATDVVTVNVLAAAGSAVPPVARAGDDQPSVDEGAAATLDGSASSDADGVLVSYRWAQLSGPTVTLSAPGAAVTEFTAPPVAPAGADLAFELAVIDDHGLRATDRVTVHVGNVNVPPTAEAGPDQAVAEGQTVTLDGSGADADGAVASYRWRQTSGPPVTLSGGETAGPTFPVPRVEAEGAQLAFELTIEDDLGASASDAVAVTVRDVPEGGDGGGGGGGCFVGAAGSEAAPWLLAVVAAGLAARRPRHRSREP